MKKKLMSALLCTAMVVSTIVGCGSEKTTTTEPVNRETSEVTTSEVTTSEVATSEVATSEVEESMYPIVDEPITIKGLCVSSRDVSNGRKVWEKLGEITGVNVEWINVDAETFTTYLASGKWEFDFIHAIVDANLIMDYGVVGGMFADYNDYLDNMPNLKKTFEDYPTAKEVVTQTNGAIYQLPNIDISATSTQIRSHYNAYLLEAAGCKVPTTVDEFYECLKTLKEYNNGEPAWCPKDLVENAYIGGMLYAAFGDDVNPDFSTDAAGKVIYNRTSDQYKHYLEFLNKVYEEELMDQEFLTVDSQYCLGLAQQGITAFWSGEALSVTEEHFPDGKLHLGTLAPLTSEYSSTQKVLANIPGKAGTFFLNAESEYLDEMTKAFDIMYATEEVVEGSGLLGQSFTFGIEGEDYVLNDDFTYEQVTPEGYEGSFSEYQYNELILINCGRATRLAEYVTSTPGNGQARQLGYVENVLPYSCDPSEVFPEKFLKFTEEEQSAMATKLTDVKAYVTEMKGKFITGVADIETEWDAYVKGLNDRGLEDVLATYQAAYDRWNLNQ